MIELILNRISIFNNCKNYFNKILLVGNISITTYILALTFTGTINIKFIIF